ncbi:U3 small nucleolar RNA-associated protein 14 homolog A [Achroia grisella]|uniref:U3 small nucleolar RNA-associated protein 14 homolog A n=1 Tax=Achroia grisella TaxID=688607 RepID=UPI0027D216E1|nr:U3 small nucleolar RNA-associated protein 14 homolog A [Achroia grisella]
MDDNEEADIVASEHERLINAVSKLDKTQHITEPTRNESTKSNTEFNLIKRSNKLNLNDVAKVLENTAHSVQIRKKLKNSHNLSSVLSKPLEKPQAERIKRATGYEHAKEKVGRWNAVVARSRTLDYVAFPLRSGTSKLQPTNEFISKFELKSELERELEKIDPPIEEEVEDEEEKIYPMSYLEMVEQRQHIAKLRAQQSYKAAKAKRQGKIKSKKYHRILKKEKLKQQLKEFEELQKVDPEEALKKLEALEKARALERHTLRHKNTGKWAKNQMIRAKYDKEVRQQISEQLAVSRSLTKKVEDTESTDDEADGNEVLPDVSLAQDPMNPWMVKRSDKSTIDATFDFGYKKYLKDRMYKRKSDSDTDSIDDETNEGGSKYDILNDSLKKINDQIDQESNNKTSNENVINKFDHTQKKRVVQKTKTVTDIKSTEKKTPNKSRRKSVKTNKLVATSNWVVESLEDIGEEIYDTEEDITSAFDSLENNVVNKVEMKLNKLRNTIELLQNKEKKKLFYKKPQNQKKIKDNTEYLDFKQQNKKAIIDESLIETDKRNIDEVQKDISSITKVMLSPNTAVENTNTNIDPSRFIEVKPKYLNSVLPKGDELDQLDDDEQVVPKVNIEEVFEEDDVVASFRQEKEDEIKKDQPEDIDLTLPGWGSWGGKGIKNSQKRKRNRFILKAAPKTPRRDENKGDIVIKEFSNPKLTLHKVTDIPFPFQSVKEYEASIRTPIGNTFIPEKAHKLLIRPAVITKAGTVIEPMDEEELLERKNRIFDKTDVINLLAKK